MFFKYASNILQEISDECMLKSFACQDPDVSRMYEIISHRIDRLLTKMNVEDQKNLELHK